MEGMYISLREARSSSPRRRLHISSHRSTPTNVHTTHMLIFRPMISISPHLRWGIPRCRCPLRPAGRAGGPSADLASPETQPSNPRPPPPPPQHRLPKRGREVLQARTWTKYITAKRIRFHQPTPAPSCTAFSDPVGWPLERGS